MPDCPPSDLTTAANVPSRSRPSCGFICWNSAEVARVLETARSIENGCIVIGRRKKRRFTRTHPIFEIEESVFTDAGVPVVVWPKERMRKFDGFFDLIFCQAPFSGSEEMKESRVVTIPEEGDCHAIVESSMNSIFRE